MPAAVPADDALRDQPRGVARRDAQVQRPRALRRRRAHRLVQVRGSAQLGLHHADLIRPERSSLT